MRQFYQGLNAEDPDLQELILAARDTAPVSGLTHNFYRYPARFSPNFVRAAINTFSKPGDWVLDPFVGGGTTLVEAFASGRNSIGVDISELATFICEVKTQLLADPDIEAIRSWAARLPEIINMHGFAWHSARYADAGYFRNLEGREYWRLRKAIEQVLSSIVRLPNEATQAFARCVLLRTSQWALDARKNLPTISRFRREIDTQAAAMIAAAIELRSNADRNESSQMPKVICINRSASGMEEDPTLGRAGPPRLVVTSPPYPGIHVLYHRWQVDGRKEAPAPFWIANRLDGAGASYYTMGDRKYPELRTYFENLAAAFRSIASICGPDTTVVQMVAFSEPEWQLPRYLSVLDGCGLQELRPAKFEELSEDGRLWREVPNRKWHARQREWTPGSREVVLIHKKSA